MDAALAAVRRSMAVRSGPTLASLLLCLCLNAAPVVAQTPERAGFATKGTVRDWKDSPVANATVSLEGPGRTYQIQTDTEGVYMFPAIVPGKGVPQASCFSAFANWRAPRAGRTLSRFTSTAFAKSSAAARGDKMTSSRSLNATDRGSFPDRTDTPSIRRQTN